MEVHLTLEFRGANEIGALSPANIIGFRSTTDQR